MPMNRRHLTIALTGILAAAGPSLTLAWVGDAPAGSDEPGRFPPPRAESGPSPPAVPGAGPATGTSPGSRVPGGGWGAPAGGPPRLEVVGGTEANGYLLRVKVGGGRPDEVQVTPSGQTLDLSLSAGTSTLEENRFSDDLGYRQGSSSSHGSVRRRVPLPADADLAHMTREVEADTLLLHIPRVVGRRAAPGGMAGPKGEPKPHQGSGQGAH